MSNQRIIYPTSEGGIAIVTPMPECGLSIEQVALKDVPAGVPYLFITLDQLPPDRTFRDAWEADFSTPDGQGMGAEAYFAAQEAQS